MKHCKCSNTQKAEGWAGVSQVFGLLNEGSRKCLMKQVSVLEFFNDWKISRQTPALEIFVNAPKIFPIPERLIYITVERTQMSEMSGMKY